MTKSRGRDLFNTSLTEIIIIIFFVLMLFALFNITKINEEKEEVDQDLRGAKETIATLKINQKNLKDRAKSTGVLDEVYENLIEEKDEEILALQEKINDLLPTEEPIKELENEEEILEGGDFNDDPSMGNCNLNFWRECASKAWPITSETDYEYLLDIGVCASGDIVAIRSEWRIKNEADFLSVNGAKYIVDKMYIPREQIGDFIGLIHNKALDFLPVQTQHVVRAVELQPVFANIWDPIRNIIEAEAKFDPFQRGSQKQLKIAQRFPANACDTFKPIKKDAPEAEVIAEIPEKDIDIRVTPITVPLKIKPPSEILASNGFILSCRKAVKKRNPAFRVTVQMTIDKEGKIINIRTDFIKKGRNTDVVADLVRTLERTKTKSIGSEYETSITYTFGKDTCFR